MLYQSFCYAQVLVKARHKKQSPQIVSSDISTRTGKAVNHVEQPGGTDDLHVTKVSSMGYLDPKQSSTDHTSQDSRGAPLVSVLYNRDKDWDR